MQTYQQPLVRRSSPRDDCNVQDIEAAVESSLDDSPVAETEFTMQVGSPQSAFIVFARTEPIRKDVRYVFLCPLNNANSYERNLMKFLER